MALTAAEEAQTRELLAQQAAILSLADSEPAIISNLGATDVSLSDLIPVITLADADLMLARQGTIDKSVDVSTLLAYMLSSPIFTGDPKAPTSAQFDNDTSIANTAFTQRALGNFSNYAGLTNGQALDSTAIGKFHGISIGVLSVTLPTLLGLPLGSTVAFINTSQTDCTIYCYGANTLAINNDVVSSLVIKNGDSIAFVKATSSLWFGFGTAALQGSGSFSAQKAASASQKMPSGIFIQAGSVTNSGTIGNPTAVVFPTAFPTAVVAVTNTAVNAATANSAAWIDSPTVSGFNSRCAVANLPSRWIAFGY